MSVDDKTAIELLREQKNEYNSRHYRFNAVTATCAIEVDAAYLHAIQAIETLAELRALFAAPDSEENARLAAAALQRLVKP